MLSKQTSAPVLHDLLIEAAETERRLPAALKKTPAAWWPDTVPEWLSYASDVTYSRLAKATPEQIDNYDFVLQVVAAVPEVEDRSLLWAVATSAAFRNRGPSWVKIAKLKHSDRHRIKSHYQVVLLSAARNWNRLVREKASK